MGKFYGVIGFGEQKETNPGIWEEVITERKYYGYVLRNLTRTQGSENLNDDLKMDNQFSIVADPYAHENFSSIRYVMWMGTKWKVRNVEAKRPRLIIIVGGVYNEGSTP
jgi:hypothetical protein